MLKRLFLLMLLASLSTYTLGCSSSESENENKETTADADLEATTDEGLDGETVTEGEPEGDVLADLGGEEGTDVAEGDVKPDEAISEDSVPSEPSDQAAAPIEESTAPPAEPAPSSGGNDLFGGTSTDSSDGYSEPKPVASLKKIQTTPYKQSGVLVNAVYLARQDDNLESVSQKTGASAKDLKKVNGFLSRGVKVGDKIYYNSKNRPTDSERLLTYYEDNNMPPEIYTAKAGDNIRTVSKNLLGHKDSWKEVWATNLDIESKQEIAEGTQIRYWSAGGAAIPVAANEPPPIQEAPPDLPPPPTDPGAPSADPLAAGSVEPPPPPPSEPPPPPVEPPPSAKPPKVAKSNDGFLIPGLGQDETFAVGAAALFLALGGFVIIMRRNRARKLSSQTQTQI